MSRVGRALLAASAAVLALLAAGCASALQVAVSLDRDGRGDLALRLDLDAEAQAALGFDGEADPAQIAARMEPLLVEGGWASGADGPIAADRDEAGTVTLETRHAFDTTAQLEALLSEPRPIRSVSPDESAVAALTDLPEQAPLLYEAQVRLGSGTGDNPGFDVFGRGGVGSIGEETCRGDEITGVGRSLRGELAISYRLSLPGGPGRTNADDTPEGENVWLARYGDCPPLQASSGGGGSSTLVNGLILAGMSGFLLAVFALRALRRRGGRGQEGGPGPRSPA